MSDSFNEAKSAWEKTILAKVLGRFPERKQEFLTGSGNPVERVYFPSNPDPEYIKQSGFPGEL